MTTFKEWYNSNLIVDRFPVSSELFGNGKYRNCNVIINVSDIFYLGNSEQIMQNGKLNYYFPMGESGKDMGISSIYGALQVMFNIYTYNPEWKILIHCQAGINRSPTVAESFYYMMTEEMLFNSRLDFNLGIHLPESEMYKAWLLNCKLAFTNPEKFLGGMLDWTLNKLEK